MNGMKKCGKQCLMCPYVKEGNVIQGGKFTWKIRSEINCETKNVVYLIECNKCRKRYIGESERMLKHRISEHKGYINNRILSKETGLHYSLPGHNIANMTVTAMEKVMKNDILYRNEKESYLINKFITFHSDMNEMP